MNFPRSRQEKLISLALDFDISYEFINLLCGDLIGVGNSRMVFQSAMQEDCVVKIQVNSKNNDNIIEYDFWNTLKDFERSRWLAPCVKISNNGKILIQKKATRIDHSNRHLVPNEIPEFLTDIALRNFGFIGEQLVSFDYAFSTDLAIKKMSYEMKKFSPQEERKVVYAGNK